MTLEEKKDLMKKHFDRAMVYKNRLIRISKLISTTPKKKIQQAVLTLQLAFLIRMEYIEQQKLAGIPTGFLAVTMYDGEQWVGL